MYTSLLLTSIFLIVVVGTYGQKPSCYRQEVYYNQEQYYETVHSYYTEGYKCGFWGWRRCTRSKSRSRSVLRYIRTTHTRQRTVCCDGFSGTWPNCKPVCNPACANEGICRYSGVNRENYCDCAGLVGWKGDQCQIDINECTELSAPPCHHRANCTNTIGSYHCQCMPGYKFDSNNFNCVDDNECTNGKHTCHSEKYCRNTDGGYTCECPKGYIINPFDPKRCLDINECTEEYAFGGCEQNCTNTRGFFRCSCNEGYEPHFYDFRRCTDIDECRWKTDDCEDLCFNVLGSFECGCSAGCKLNLDEKSCSDINECEEGTSGCQQNCTNMDCSNGRYNCSCFAGYVLHEDKLNCININECEMNNGGCQHSCIDTEGSYECTCYAGYKLNEDQHSCQALPCATLERPNHGLMTCTSNASVVGDNCTFTCDRGYELIGSNERICLPNATWSGDITECAVLKCQPLVPSTNSRISSPCSQEVNSSCVLTCQDGYYMEGSVFHIQTCELEQSSSDVSWSLPPNCLRMDACSPNPCKNMGICTVTQGNIPSCTCPNDNIQGDFCEETKIEVADLPLLVRNRQSNQIQVYAKTSSEVEIDIVADLAVTAYPGHISIASPTTTANFSLMSSHEGIYTISYSIHTTDSLISPDKQMLLVTSEGSEPADYYNGMIVPNEGLFPGCCKTKIQLHCSRTSHNAFLSSSCSWSYSTDMMHTSGIVFIHKGQYLFPLSIAGIRFPFYDQYVSVNQLNGGTMSCSMCQAVTNEYECYDYKPNINDVSLLLKRKALVKEFYRRLVYLLPHSIRMTIITHLDTGHKYDFHAFVMKGNELKLEERCTHLDVQNENTYYAIKVNEELRFSYFNEHEINSTDKTPLCFAIDLCEVGVTHISGFADSENHRLMNLQSWQPFYERNWLIKFLSISLYQYEGDYQVENNFWNGTSSSFFAPTSTKASLKSKLDMNGNFSGTDLPTSFKFQGDLHVMGDCEKMLTGKMVFSVNLNIEGTPVVLVTKVVNGKCYLKGCSGASYFEASANALFSSSESSTEIFDFLFATKECQLNTYLKYNSQLMVQQISLQSECMKMRFEGLEFNSMNTVVDINSQEMVINDDAGIKANMLIRSSVNNPINLGQFISIYPLSGLPNIQFTVFSNFPGKLGIIHEANFSLFGSHYVSSIFLNSHDSASFSITNKLINSEHPVSIQGSIDTKYSWNDIRISLSITFSEMHKAIQEIVETQLLGEAILATRRMKTVCNDSKDEITRNIITLESNITDVQSYLNDLTQNLNSMLNEQRRIQFYKEKAGNVTAHLFEQYYDTENDILKNDSICSIEPCSYLCKGGLVGTHCYSPLKVVRQYSCIGIEYQSIQKAYSIAKPVTKRVRSCNGPPKNKHVGIAFLFGTIVSGGNPLVGALAAGVASLFGRKKASCRDYTVYHLEPKFFYKYEIVGLEAPANCHYVKFNGYTNQVCRYESSCAILQEDSICVEENKECLRNRTAILETVLEETELHERLIGARDNYDRYTKELIDINYDIVDLEIEKLYTENKLKDMKLLLEGVKTSLTLQIQSCENVKQEVEEGIIVKNLVDNEGIENLFQVHTVSADVSILHETPIIFPVNLAYHIPFRGNEMHTATFSMDISAPKDSIEQTIGSSMKDQLLSLYTSSPNLRRQKKEVQPTIIQHFQTMCEVFNDVFNYMTFVNQVFNESKNIATDIIFSLSKEQEKVTKIFNELLKRNNSNSNVSRLATIINKEKDQTGKYIEYIEKTSESVYETAVIGWQTLMQSIHNNTRYFGQYSCFSFDDCLVTSIEAINKLVAEIPNRFIANAEIYSQLMTLQNASEISKNQSMEMDEISTILIDIISLLKDIEAIGYWCARKPTVLKHPVNDSIVPVGSKIEMSCEGSSLLPVGFKWKKNGKTLSHQVTKKLFIKNAEISDIGLYHCEIYNIFGISKSNNVIVRVYKIPHLNARLESQDSFIGADSVEMLCDISGYPDPEYKWFFMKKNKTTWEVLDQNNKLAQIENISLSNEGWYKCEGHNSYGLSTSNNAYLTVLQSSHSKAKLEFNSTIVLDSTQPELILVSFKDSKKSLNSSLRTFYNEITENSSVVYENFKVKMITEHRNLVHLTLKTSNNNIGEVDSDTFLYELKVLENAKLKLSQSARKAFTMEDKLHFFHKHGYSIESFSISQSYYKFVCPEGYGYDGNSFLCVHCSQGTYWNGYRPNYIQLAPGNIEKIVYPVCSPCHIDHYQNQTGSTVCEKCPINHSTIYEGSKKIQDCQEMCGPGSYSTYGLVPCTKCNSGEYQLEFGKKFCLPCSNRTVNNQCLPVIQCGVDHYSHSGLIPCKRCDVGEEQTLIGKSYCVSCKKNSTSSLCKSVLSFEKNSPLIFESNVTVNLKTQNLQSFSCTVSNIGNVDCSAGSFVLTDIKPNTRYTITLEGLDKWNRRITNTRQIRTVSEKQCSVHLINNGITVQDTRVTVEFTIVGANKQVKYNAECAITGNPKNCASPVVFHNLKKGSSYYIVIRPACSGKKSTSTIFKRISI